MKPFRFLFVVLFALFLALALSSAAPLPAAHATNDVPDGLSAADWAAIQALVPSDYIKASNTGANDEFGGVVAVDGNTVVVGAHLEDSNATGVNGNQANDFAVDSGAAYVFTRIEGVWTQQAYLKASNTEAYDWFGITVAIDGDTVVVGARREASNATGVNGNQANNSFIDAGAAYVFTRTGGVWSQQAYLKASNTGANDWFGIAVAIDGDTVVVGARGEASNATGINGNQADNSAVDSGAAYVFTRIEGVWSQQAYLKASNTDAFDYFGWDVAVEADTVIVGAPKENSSATGVNGNQTDNSASLSGAAYVFTRTGNMWSQQAYLKASNTGMSDYFGWAVAVDGDTVVVGAFLEDSNATGVNGNQANNSFIDAGAAYVFTRTGEVWIQQAYLKASNTEWSDQFGFAVAVEGDTVIVGAPGEASNATGVNGNQADNSAFNSGAGYLFTRTGGEWSQQGYLKASNTETGDRFGFAVAVVEDDTVVMGAYFEDSNATGINGNQTNNSASLAGAVYLFRQGHLLSVRRVGTGQVTSVPAKIACGTVCTAGFAFNTVVTLTATADLGSVFTGWSGDVLTTTNPITVTMDGAKAITATFALNQYELNVATVGNGTAAPNSGMYDYGTVITLTATADLGSTFTGWSGDVLTTTNPITITMDSAKAITATFALNQYTITLSAEPTAGGTVAGGGLVSHGQMVTATATAETGYTFLHWAEGEDVVSTTANYSFTATADRALVAHFAADAPKIYLPLIVR